MRNIPLITGLPFNLKPAIDVTDDLPSRPKDPNPLRVMEDITHVSVHHSAVEGGTPRGYANHHVMTNKWYHIGYHDVICGDQLYQTNDWRTFSYHTSSHNAYTLGISISGNLSKREMSEVERNLLYARLLTYLKYCPNLTIENIWGHNEFPDNETECPCIDMNRVRNDVKTLQNRLQQGVTWKSQMAAVREYINQVNYMTNLIKAGPEDGNAMWANNQLQAQIAYFRANHLL